MSEKNKDDDWEPDWMNPANDRKSPYTDEEIEMFVEGFIIGLDKKEWATMKSEHGEEGARAKIRAGIIRMDERNLLNIKPEGPIH